ncbi:CRISPR-associated endonuclease Cas3'' [Stomatohabitans albus]|uniref:CRISPR-associated endonuclease Cas3'' n=1 Tax=Stomatohabitans albus TaxID=3110766 RepID=UPI00300D4548
MALQRLLERWNQSEAPEGTYYTINSSVELVDLVPQEFVDGKTGTFYVAVGKPLTTQDQKGGYVFETDGSDAASSLIGVPLSLNEHSDDVAAMAERYAHSLGIESLAESLRLAGSFHDIGKADSRFQTVLYGGDVIAAAMAADGVLAKSVETPKSGAQIAAIYEQSGYVRGTRHELMSLALLEHAQSFETRPDADLVKHLVATHHGYCRSIPPRQDDPKPVDVHVSREGYDMEASSAHGLDAVSSGVTDRFWAMTERFGWYGLAWLEAVLRLADHHESARQSAVRSGTKRR